MVRLNNVQNPKAEPLNVNPSLGPASLDAVNSRKSIPDATGDDTDCDADTDGEGCEEINSLNVNLSQR